MFDGVDPIIDAANDGYRWGWDESSVYTKDGGESVFEDTFVLESSAEFIATFDPVTVRALVDVAKAFARYTEAEWGGPERDAAWDDACAALDRLKETLT